MKKLNLSVLLLSFLFISVLSSKGQQVPDTAWEFTIYQAAYQKGVGPVIFIDEAHNNFHTKEGGFFAFSKLLQQDGYSAATFTGSAFMSPKEVIPVLIFLKDHYALLPDTAWRFNAKTPRQNLKGFNQGALLNFGKGKVAVFGEAAMFTAQIANGNFNVGMNSESAPQNAQFTLNLIHWLDGVKVYRGAKVKENKTKN